MSPSRLSSASPPGRRRRPRWSVSLCWARRCANRCSEWSEPSSARLAIVVLAALFRQDRVSFLVGLAFWCAASAFVATLLTQFRRLRRGARRLHRGDYCDRRAWTGRKHERHCLHLRHRSRARDLHRHCLRRRRARLDRSRPLATKARNGMRGLVERDHGWVHRLFRDRQRQPGLSFERCRRELLRRVIALDPMIDAAIGEASDLRYRSAVLQRGCRRPHGDDLGLAQGCVCDRAQWRCDDPHGRPTPFTTNSRARGFRQTQRVRPTNRRRCATRAARPCGR